MSAIPPDYHLHDGPRLESAGDPRRRREPRGPAGRDAAALSLQPRSAVPRSRQPGARSRPRVGAADAPRRRGHRHARYLRRTRGRLRRAGLPVRSAGRRARPDPRPARQSAPPTGLSPCAFNRQELPCFTVWKNTGAMEDGYVTGLEPATNYPNFKGFERQQGRVPRAAAGRSLGVPLDAGGR